MPAPTLSVIVPAYDEQAALPATLNALAAAQSVYRQAGYGEAEVIVVDNASKDATPTVAREHGAAVVFEPSPGVAHARNAGAAAARASRLVFIDADTLVPPHALAAISAALDQRGCVGGALAAEYHYRKRLLRPYMELWKVVARAWKMTQGVAQFVTADAFAAVGGYDVRLHMAEDSDFNWKLRRYAKQVGGYTEYLADVVVFPSARRLDEWPIWRTVLMTNPLITRVFLRSRRFWSGWRERTVR